ncbi:MAG TPA: hypothetical protein VFA04_13785 [Bryobacteraceae bacterium]|nr:hypothetical protein [Bryobacteraceae bacterium]
MSTAAQITANQKNAQASTGPRTAQGKAASSQNALKFGLTSNQILLPWENPADFEALHAALVTRFQPADDAERLLVDSIALAEWRERRTEIAQNAWLAQKIQNIEEDRKPWATAAHLTCDEVARFQKYAAAYRRERNRAWSRLEAMQKARRAEAQRRQEAEREATVVAATATTTAPATSRQKEPKWAGPPSAPSVRSAASSRETPAYPLL